MTENLLPSPAASSSISWICPKCQKPLAVQDALAIVCAVCEVAYPVRDGIPILVPDAREHLERMDTAIHENPAWYESSQIAWHDRGPCRHHLGRRRAYVESVLRNYLAPTGKAPRLLDLGCGDGANARWLANFADELHGCDYNLLRLRRCNHLMGKRITLCLANVHHLPYPDNFFDAVFFNHVLEHIPDDERALRSILRILRPGGLFLLGVPNEGAAWWQLAYRLQPESLAQSDHVHFYTIPEIKEKVAAAGFELRDTHPTGWGPPHWKLDERLRKFRALDNAFEAIGSRLARGQASSLYLVLAKPSESAARHAAPGTEIVLYDESMREEWNDLAERSPQGWLFHRREFIDLANRTMNLREFSLAARKGNRIAGILPLTCALAERPPKMGSLAFGYAGIALDPELGRKEGDAITEALFARALRLARQEKCKALHVTLPPLAPAQLTNPHGVSPLDPWGFADTSTSTYIVNLTPDEENLFQALRPTARQMIRKAGKSGVVIRAANSASDIDAYYALHRDTYERTGTAPHPRAYFEGIFSILAPAGLARIWIAELDGKPIGFLNMATYRKGAFFWTGCGSQLALDVGANYLLQWRAIRSARAEGCAHYEVGEAFPGHRGDKLAGLDTFKSAFGGERWPFHKGRIEISPARPSALRRSLYYLKEAVKSVFQK